MGGPNKKEYKKKTASPQSEIDHLVAREKANGPTNDNSGTEGLMPPEFTFGNGVPVQMKKDPRSVEKCLEISVLTDEELKEEVKLLQTYIEENPDYENLHYLIMTITRMRDELKKRNKEEVNPDEFSEKDYNKLWTYDKDAKKWKLKSSINKRKELKGLESPEGHQEGIGGHLEFNEDNEKLFNAYFSNALPTGMTVDDLKLSSSSISNENKRREQKSKVTYKELPPPDLWPSMKKSLVLIIKLQDLNGITYDVHSSYRSFKVNAYSGGAKGSAHTKFNGLDVTPTSDKKKNESFLKYFWIVAGSKENMGLGFYSRGRQHIDASGYRKWEWAGKSELKKWKKQFLKDWGQDKLDKIDTWGEVTEEKKEEKAEVKE